jgi:hypothetical protein
MAVTTAQVQELYVAYLGRAADKAGLDYWMAELNAEPAVLTLENLRANFVTEQQEYADIYGGLSREETVIQIYNNLFGRAPDAAGLSYWTTGEGAGVNADQLLVAFINGAAAADAQVVTNKALVANIYTEVAGSTFSLADAAAAIAKVDGTTASVSAAIAALTDLPSVAVPGTVALVQAAVTAAAAVTASEESATKVAAMLSINEKVNAINETLAVKATLGVPADGGDAGNKIDKYSEVKVALSNAQAVRTAVSTDTTAVLTTKAGEANSALVAARAELVNGVSGALAAVKAYEAAAAKAAATSSPAEADVLLRTGQLEAVATAKPAVWGEAVGKLSAATLALVDVDDDGVSAEDLYDFLSTSDSAAVINEVKAAFGAVEGFGAVADLAAQRNADVAADKALLKATNDVKALISTSASTDLDEAFLAAFTKNATAEKTLANAKAADALVSDAKAIDAGHEALVAAAKDAGIALSAAKAAVAFGTPGTTDADVFFFGTEGATAADASTVRAIAGNDDGAVTVTSGDVIYIGSGWTLNGSATLNSDGVIVGGNNGVKEIFFIQNGSSFQAVIETADFGSATAIAANDNVAVITLTGVESLDQVSFANGMITIA